MPRTEACCSFFSARSARTRNANLRGNTLGILHWIEATDSFCMPASSHNHSFKHNWTLDQITQSCKFSCSEKFVVESINFFELKFSNFESFSVKKTISLPPHPCNNTYKSCGKTFKGFFARQVARKLFGFVGS